MSDTPGNKASGLVAFACLVLAGCAAPTADDIGFPPPSDYKETIKAYVHANFFDPYSLRDVALTEPHAGRWNFIPGWRVCLAANAKNRLGGYAGLNTTGFFFYHAAASGQLTFHAEVADAACQGYAYTPWPELDSDPALKPNAGK